MFALLVIAAVVAGFYQIRQLQRRVDALRSEVESLHARASRAAASAAPPATAAATGATGATAVAPEATAATAAAPEGAAEPLRPQTSPGQMRPAQQVPPAGTLPESVRDSRPAAPWSAPAAAAAAPVRSGLDLETRVGMTWGLRVGLAALTIAAALFARSIVPNLTPSLKVALAYAGALALFGVGRFFEAKLERFARPVMAAGLSLAFFVSFASHFVPAMRAVPLVPALLWMALGVVSVMALAGRWRSEPTAGLAILLGHLSAYVAAGAADSYSLVAIVFLSVTAVVLLWRHDWLPLSLLAVVAAYGSHLLWALAERPTLPAQRGLALNLLFLSSYYAIFLAADLLWWRRRPAASRSGAQRALGRSLGPANLVLFASLSSFLFIASDAPGARMEWFFFALGALQWALAFVQRRLHNPDAMFYPAVGTLLITIGFATAFDALSLNLVLALEALLLLLAAHRTRLRTFHLLAQGALAANFVHYWYAARAEPTLALFLGGLVVAAVYFLQSALEERWYRPGHVREWTGAPAPDGLTAAVASRFDAVWRAIAPLLAHAHAMAGAAAVIDQAERFLTPQSALSLLASAMFAVAAGALLRRSVPLLLATAVLQTGLAAVALTTPLRDSLLLSGLAAVSILVALLLVEGAMRGGFRGRQQLAAILVAQYGLLFALLLPLLLLRATGVDPAVTTALLWVALVALALLAVHRIYRAFALAAADDDVDTDMGAVGAWMSGTTAVLGALLAWRALAIVLGPGVAVPVWLVVFGAASAGAAAMYRAPAVYAGGFALLLAATAQWLWRWYAVDPVVREPWTALLIGALPLAIALLHDRYSAGVTGVLRLVSHVVAYTLYACVSVVAITVADTYAGAGWRMAWLALLPVALYLAGSVLGAPRAGTAALVVLAWLMTRQLQSMAVAAAAPAAVLAAGLSLAAAALLLERLLARTVAARGAVYGSATRFFGPALVAAAAAVALPAIAAAAGTRTTAAWSLLGATIMALGFLLRSPHHRRVALAVFGFSLLRVLLVDTRGLTDMGKSIAFLVLGLCLVSVAWLYARFGRGHEWL